jgi:hypothetical protein
MHKSNFYNLGLLKIIDESVTQFFDIFRLLG